MENENLLQSGEFEKEFAAYYNDPQLEVASGWAPWWQEPAEGAPEWKNQKPTFGPFLLDDVSVQEVSSPYATHRAGLWQQVPAATGNRYALSVMAQAWSSEDDVPGSRRESSDVNMRIGVDPSGGLDPDSPIVKWSKTAQPLSRWETLRLSFEAEADIVTIFLESSPSLPKRQQRAFWRDALLLPDGRYRREIAIVGPGDTHINLAPEHPEPHEQVLVAVSSMRNHPFVNLRVRRPDGDSATVLFKGSSEEDDRIIWRYAFTPESMGLYDLRFEGDMGARLLAQRLVRASSRTQLVPSGEPRESYRRIYVLLPPTATEEWAIAATRGSFAGRFTVGYSADDAGVGDLEDRIVLAVNPHHWPGVLTAAWFRQHYPGAQFTPVVANAPEDLEEWLRTWSVDS